MTMPHMSSGGSEDFYSTDEVKVYKDEGNKDEEKRSSENLTEEKLGLVTESEEGKNSSLQGNFASSEKSSSTVTDDDKSPVGPAAPGQGPPGSIGFFLPHYASAYPNGSSVAGKFGMVQPPYPGLVMYNDFAQPPPAHKGYPPVYTDPKTGLPRPPMYAAYPAPPGQFPHPLYSPEFTSASWHRPGYPLTSGAFAGSFPPSLSSLSRYGPPGLLSHPGLGHPGIPHHASLGAGPKSELMSPQHLSDSHRHLSSSSHGDENSSCKSSHHGSGSGEDARKKPYVKKPLNAFMLFMKEMRPKVISECTLKESAAINQILGRRWHALDRSEQAKYYEMARKEKELHLQLYPGWSARDNYAAHQKKKKRKKDGHGGGGGSGMGGAGLGGSGLSPLGGVGGIGGGLSLGGLSVDSENKPGECPNEKKCRARFGMEQQSRWCKPCRRKKKCIRYKLGDGEGWKEGNDESLLKDQDSSAASGCESDSTSHTDSPGLSHRGEGLMHSPGLIHRGEGLMHSPGLAHRGEGLMHSPGLAHRGEGLMHSPGLAHRGEGLMHSPGLAHRGEGLMHSPGLSHRGEGLMHSPGLAHRGEGLMHSPGLAHRGEGLMHSPGLARSRAGVLHSPSQARGSTEEEEDDESPLSPIFNESDDDIDPRKPDAQEVLSRPLSLVTARTQSSACVSPPQPRHIKPHLLDSFMFPSPPFHMPYHSPLAPHLSYLRFPPFHYHSPYMQSAPTFPLDFKHIT